MTCRGHEDLTYQAAMTGLRGSSQCDRLPWMERPGRRLDGIRMGQHRSDRGEAQGCGPSPTGDHSRVRDDCLGTGRGCGNAAGNGQTPQLPNSLESHMVSWRRSALCYHCLNRHIQGVTRTQTPARCNQSTSRHIATLDVNDSSVSQKYPSTTAFARPLCAGREQLSAALRTLSFRNNLHALTVSTMTDPSGSTDGHIDSPDATTSR